MRRLDPELLADRARDLGLSGLNGFELLFVELVPVLSPTPAELPVSFHNTIAVSDIDDAVNVTEIPVSDIFTISGGTRIIGGRGAGQLQVVSVAAGRRPVAAAHHLVDRRLLDLHARCGVRRAGGDIDPSLFASLAFKFRPGCFTNDCAPALAAVRPAPGPAIDYLAKDYDSFRHTLMAAMAERVPGWESTSEADHDQVLIDLFAARPTSCRDYQDRVMNEAYLGRRRASASRSHAMRG